MATPDVSSCVSIFVVLYWLCCRNCHLLLLWKLQRWIIWGTYVVSLAVLILMITAPLLQSSIDFRATTIPWAAFSGQCGSRPFRTAGISGRRSRWPRVYVIDNYSVRSWGSDAINYFAINFRSPGSEITLRKSDSFRSAILLVVVVVLNFFVCYITTHSTGCSFNALYRFC